MDTPAARMPEGIINAYIFQVFNTCSFAIVLGAPMLLFFKEIGASETVIGIVAALPMLLSILQIPAAKFVERVGYRNFVLRGWTARCLLILGVALVAFLPAKIDNPTRVALMLFFLFGYNFSRGISIVGWMPWMCELVPESIRGQYVSRDQMASSIAQVVCFLVNAAFLSETVSRHSFGIMFLGSFAAALMSLRFLQDIPDVPVTPSIPNENPVPWLEMLFYPPFFKLVLFNVILYSALAASTVFWIPFFRESLHISNSMSLVWAAIANLTAFVTYYFVGRNVDRIGSRPILVLACGIYTAHYIGWCSMAAGIYPAHWTTVLAQQVSAGIGGALFALANTRLAMGTVPTFGRSHFFAIFNVINYIVLGVMPIIWGIVIDELQGWHAHWAGWDWNKYSVLYAVLAATSIVAQFRLHRLSEPRAMTMDAFFRELLIETPVRAITRIWQRRPFV